MDPLLLDAAERGARYLDSLAQRRVGPADDAVRELASLNGPLPAGPSDPADVLAALDDIGSPATMASAGGRFFGFVIGGALPVTVAANWLAAAWDQNAAMAVTSPTAAALEVIALRWLVELFGLPPSTACAFVTGATLANFTGLAAARHAVLERAGWDVEAQGLFGAPPITVVVNEECHPTVIKALGLLGLGRSRLIAVPTDSQGRMRADALPALTAPAIVCVQAGNINTGAFDPFEPIIAAAHEAGAWVHVDGAFGLWALAAPQRAHLAAGALAADSWATDAHKWLNVPYDSGLAMVRDPQHLQAAMSLSAAYLPVGEVRDPSHFTPELSRRARGVEVWSALRTLGRQGVAEMVERCCQHAARFAEGLSAAGYEILNEVVLNQVLVSFGDAAATERVVRAIQEEGTCWAGTTTWRDRRAMRISVSAAATTSDDVERSLDAIIRVAREVV